MTLVSFSSVLKCSMVARVDIAMNTTQTHVRFFRSMKPSILYTLPKRWFMGDSEMCAVSLYAHLGIKKDVLLSTFQLMIYSWIKLRGTHLGITNSVCTMNYKTISPWIRFTKTVVIPEVLYEWKLWNNYASIGMLCFERAHKVCIQFIPRIPFFINSEFTWFDIASHSIGCEIDYR